MKFTCSSYEIPLNELKELFCKEFNVPAYQIDISAITRQVGDQREPTLLFVGLRVEVDHTRRPEPDCRD
jgi:hypothetical protein